MATVGMVAFRNSSPHGKLHVLQESINNANNANRREVLVMKKKKLDSSPESPKAKKQSKVKDCATRVQNPPPVAVARRNARERNRVKQVNNGFATLRQHIPNEIAEIYENANNNRTTNKKLSKVETLRMAVEYIRSLENLLSIDDGREYKENSANLSLASFPSPASSESLQNNSSYEQSYFSLQSPIDDEEDSNPATPLPPVTSHHYSRIPGTNAFQLIPGPMTIGYEDEENVHPLTPNSDMLPQEDLMIQPSIINGMDFVQGIAQPSTVIHPQILSPNVYSENSLSPNQEYADVKYQMIPAGQFLYQNPMILNQGAPITPTADAKSEVLAGDIMQKYSEQSDMKQEPSDGSYQHDDDMEEVMNWWETEGRHEDES